MSQAVKRPAAYDDFLNLPKDQVGGILNGELHAHPPPKYARVYSALGGNLWNPFDSGKALIV